jgi:AcrR family transcriptional regulator
MNAKAKTMQKKRTGRTYDSSSRREAAQATRQSILQAALQMFLLKGYAATTMPAIAQAAGIAMDTVYATVGKKPALFRLLVETAISGTDTAVPAEERDYVRAIRAESNPTRKLEIYAAALSRIQATLAPLFRVLQGAATLDPELNALWQEISQRRARNMRLFATDLAATGRLHHDLTIDKAADIIWSMNSPEFYLLLVQERGWSPAEFEQWLSDAWIRLLLKPR